MKSPNAYSADCPTRQILDRVGDKWAVLILLLLRQEPWRFNQLRRAIEGISQKMLSQVLKSLERDGLIRRNADYWDMAAFLRQVGLMAAV